MNLEELISSHESKTIEFKESTQSLQGILKTIVAFANTAGGMIVIGVEDKTKKIIGLEDVLFEEERLTNSIADSIVPFLVANIEIQTFRDKEIILVSIPHMAGPYYLKSAGPEKGVYVRFGSTNRVVDAAMLASMKLLALNLSFDELPYTHGKTDLDWDALKKEFKKVNKKVTPQKAKNLGLITEHSGKDFSSNGGMILFGKERLRKFPDAIIRCSRFLGLDKAHIHDHADYDSYPTQALEEAIRFVERNTAVHAEIGRLRRTDIREYPPIAVREAITNALLHADYSIKGSSILIAIFDDRIEITNPGGLVFNQTLTKALSGSSILRNHVIGRTFRELNLIERWGSGLQRIIKACSQRGLETPKFEERDNEFRVTLYATKIRQTELDENQKEFVGYLKKKKKLSTKEAAEFWGITPRNALVRLKQLTQKGVLTKVGTSAQDPKSKYVLVKK